jgi:hypothetical protein
MPEMQHLAVLLLSICTCESSKRFPSEVPHVRRGNELVKRFAGDMGQISKGEKSIDKLFCCLKEYYAQIPFSLALYAYIPQIFHCYI